MKEIYRLPTPELKTRYYDGKNTGPALVFYTDAKDPGVQHGVIEKLQDQCATCPLKAQGRCSGVDRELRIDIMNQAAGPYVVAQLRKEMLTKVRRNGLKHEEEIPENVRSTAKCNPPRSGSR